LPKRENTAETPGSSDSDHDPRRLLGFRLPLLSNTWSALSARRFTRLFGLKQLEARILFVLGINKAVSLKYLGQAAGIEKAYASRAITALVESGLVAKTADLADKRSVSLELTLSGRVLYDAILDEAASRDDEWISVLNATERRNLHNYLDRLIRRAHVMSVDERRQT
jgi:DNA-binding MarR family transcriptional regulator